MEGNSLNGRQIKSICVFCGSKFGNDPEYARTARVTGTLLAEKNITLVYGGGCVGLMGELATAAIAAGGNVIGVIPAFLEKQEVALSTVQELIVVQDMHQRKRRFLELSDAFIALPGGVGTFEEITEVLSWLNLNLHNKPLGFLNTLRYFDPLLRMFEHARSEGFLDSRLIPELHQSTSIEDLVDTLQKKVGSTITGIQFT